MKRLPKQSSALIPAIAPLEKGSSIALHKQLYERFRDAILSGQLVAGTRLPSTRDLARHLGVSRNTVMTTFEQLLAEGFLTGKVGAGTTVTYQLGQQTAFRSPTKLSGAVPAVTSRLADLLSARGPELFLDRLGPFRSSLPALDLFPWPTWFSLVSQCARRQNRAHFGYCGPLGLQSFREAIGAYLRTARNVRCDAGQIIIVSGAQQALVLASQVLVERGDLAWLEEPGYPYARDVFLVSGIRCGPVPVDDEGLNVKLGEKLYPDARIVYVTPSHQYPLGMTMSLQRRMDLLEWAAANGAWVLEDDYDSEYRYTSRPISSLQGLSGVDRVIYIGTFSKVLFPALRVGYMVVPAELVDRFIAVRAASDVFAPTLYQAVLTEFIEKGHFARHIRRMRATYSARRDELVTCLQNELGASGRIGFADSGTSLVLRLDDDCNDIELCKQAARLGIVAKPLSINYCSEPTQNGLILGFGGTDVSEIRPAVVTLRKAFDEMKRAAGK
ncbi:MAG: PLP-dependent aminotransferase family protein [Acidobacteriaceae bacterium]|nr:PLP-dependent aminotransferase family protein [Acidobacteriaceae bacterium]